MAGPSKKQRLSYSNSGSQTTGNMFTASQRDAAGGEGRFVEGSILRITMKNFL